MAGMVRLQSLRKLLVRPNSRRISTSKKTNDTANIADAPQCKPDPPALGKNWVSYGFETRSKEADRNSMHMVFFASISLCIVGGGFYFAYIPDFNLRNWSQREAYLELKRRESAGLPLVDPNLIPVESINLPSDEELGDTEIII